MSQSLKKHKILNFSSSQNKEDFLPSSNNNNLYIDKGFIDYMKNSRNKVIFNPACKTNKIKMNKCKTKNDIISKTFELESNKKDDINDSKDKKSTSKIDYRHFKKYPLKEIFPLKLLEEEMDKLYWLVTYDKLIKSKNIVKILNYDIMDNNDKNQIKAKPMYTESSLKIKTMKIPGFELFFVKGFDKPFVRPSWNKNSFILAKLYLLKKKEINKIVNFINRTDDKINIEKYIPVTKRDIFQYIEIKKNSDINIDINFPYCYIYYLGKYMNISMYLFTNSFNYIQTYNLHSNIIYSLPSSKKLYKLIKILIRSFPEYNAEYIINNIIKYDLYSNSKEKKYEIFKYLSMLKHSVPNKNLLNKILRETITGIQTSSSASISSPAFDSGEQVKTSENDQNNQKISIAKQSIDDIKNNIPAGCKFEFKSSLNSKNNFFLNGQNGTINLSTNHTMIPSNSIPAFSNKNSITNNIPLITIPYDNNNTKKDNCGNFYLSNKNLIPGKNLMPKKNIEQKKISAKNFGTKLKFIEDKENIDINSIFNKKKEDNIFDNKKNKEKNYNNNYKDALIKKKKNEKKKGNKDNKNEYHTPIKRKKIKYYK